jgi:nitroreductase
MSTPTADGDLEPSTEHPFVPLEFERLPEAEMLSRARSFYELMDRRRSIREFSGDPVPRELIELAIRTASTAPSGAHQQPWTFVVVGAAETKRRIRQAAEKEERHSYASRMPEEWKRALAPLGTDQHKSYLEIVPWIVVGFEQIHGYHPDGSVRKHYYAKQSIGLACGMLITALHQMGLATLTHTPSPMKFLAEILGRPANEKPFILFPVGYPAAGCRVPDLTRKPLSEIMVEPPTSASR